MTGGESGLSLGQHSGRLRRHHAPQDRSAGSMNRSSGLRSPAPNDRFTPRDFALLRPAGGAIRLRR
ncbi:hypothetical protein SALB1_2515 [Salinisphaera sp. LB1]|nr:hypothetical protein SALB1_2515 [Salinisphaera sp. LB1]